MNRLEFGLKMEGEALVWYQQRFGGIRLLDRNFRTRGGEIDLIFEESRESGVELVFVEVRARRAGSLQSGIESLGLGKQFRLRRAVQYYLGKYRGPARTVRVDALSWDGGTWSHYPNLRLPE